MCKNLVISIVTCSSCSQAGRTDARHPEHRAIDGIESVKKWGIVADSSIDVAEFKKQYEKNPDRWNMAFKFLHENDLKALAPGRYELDGKNLYVNIDEYETKAYESTKYESHRQYADIQYMVYGVENISIRAQDSVAPLIPYNVDRDIEFYTSDEDSFHQADSSRFFVFFPDDAHRPCVRLKNSGEKVRKAVVKVKLL